MCAQAVECSYKDNPYHNNTHAADVVQSLAWLLSSDTITRQLTDLELLCMIIAATVHDVGHPGEPAQPLRLLGMCHPLVADGS